MTIYAGQWGPENFIDTAGNAVPSAAVSIFLTDGTTLATLYANRDRTVGLANPLPTDQPTGSLGLDDEANGFFWVDPGRYIMSVSYGGSLVFHGPITVGVDPSESAPGVFTDHGAVGATLALALAPDARHRLVLTQDCTVTVSPLLAAAAMELIVEQNGTGGWDLTVAAGLLMNGNRLVVATGAGEVSIVSVSSDNGARLFVSVAAVAMALPA